MCMREDCVSAHEMVNLVNAVFASTETSVRGRPEGRTICLAPAIQSAWSALQAMTQTMMSRRQRAGLWTFRRTMVLLWAPGEQSLPAGSVSLCC